MDTATVARLDRINREFYERVAPEFSRSRRHLNEGIVRGLEGAAGRWPAGLEAVEIDLGTGPWPPGPFDLVCCLAVLHHIPGREARIGLLRRIAAHVAPRGRWLVSVWQVLHRERFRRRTVAYV